MIHNQRRRERWEHVTATDLSRRPVAGGSLDSTKSFAVWPTSNTWRHHASGALVTIDTAANSTGTRPVVVSLTVRASEGGEVSLRHVARLGLGEVIELSKGLSLAFGGSPDDWTRRDHTALMRGGPSPRPRNIYTPAKLRRLAKVYVAAQKKGESTTRAVRTFLERENQRPVTATSTGVTDGAARKAIQKARTEVDPETGSTFLPPTTTTRPRG